MTLLLMNENKTYMGQEADFLYFRVVTLLCLNFEIKHRGGIVFEDMHNTVANKLNAVLRQIVYKILCLDMPAGDAQQAACMVDTMFYLDKPNQCHRSYCALPRPCAQLMLSKCIIYESKPETVWEQCYTLVALILPRDLWMC
jgi:hypothetical protein